jgi:hypothetical protein
LRANGQAQPGFPVVTGGIITASPVVGDIDGDGALDITFGAYDNIIYAYNHLGQPLRNFPIPTTSNGQITGSAALADLDGDGDCEVITGVRASGNNLEVIDYKTHLPAEIFPWPIYGKDIRRTCFYGAFDTGIEDGLAIPNSFSLEQNYPNPFNANTVISFNLPSAQEVNLSIYDLLGRCVKTLYAGYMQSGTHNMTWNGTRSDGISVSSGIYFYRMETSNTISTKRMTLLK